MIATDSTATDRIDLAQLQREYLGDLLAARGDEAYTRIMSALRSGHTIPDIYFEVFQESLYEVGRLWEANRITIAGEHISTAITQFIMARLYEHLDVSDVRRGNAVMAGVRGELHQIGVNMVSDALEADGWNVMFLGASIPPERIIHAVKLHQATLLGISATLSSSIPHVVELVTAVRQELEAQAPHFLLGGGAFRTIRALPGELAGCLLAHTLRDAVQVARTLASEGTPSR